MRNTALVTQIIHLEHRCAGMHVRGWWAQALDIGCQRECKRQQELSASFPGHDGKEDFQAALGTCLPESEPEAQAPTPLPGSSCSASMGPLGDGSASVGTQVQQSTGDSSRAASSQQLGRSSRMHPVLSS